MPVTGMTTLSVFTIAGGGDVSESGVSEVAGGGGDIVGDAMGVSEGVGAGVAVGDIVRVGVGVERDWVSSILTNVHEVKVSKTTIGKNLEWDIIINPQTHQ
jgi:hypothetical protein